jgi:hypothetical protein
MGIPGSWDQATKEAMVILGKDGKIPPPKVNLGKYHTDFDKADKEYDAAVDVLQAKILAMQNTRSSVRNVLKQYQDLISKNNFALDPAAEGNKDKIQKAQDLLDGYLDSQMENLDTDIKNLDELDKHSMAISKYQSKCT